MLKQVRRKLFTLISRWVAPGVLRSIRATNRYKVTDEAYLNQFDAEGSNFILSFWHGQMLPMLMYFTNSDFDHTQFYTFISPHRDGEYITEAAEGLGINALRTSLRDRRIHALGRAIELSKAGKNLALTPDGPIGPAFQAKEGIIQLSEKTEKPILPASSLPSRFHVFSSWDHFVMPYPGGEVFTKFGAPLRPWEINGGINKKKSKLQNHLNQLTRSIANDFTSCPEYLKHLPAE